MDVVFDFVSTVLWALVFAWQKEQCNWMNVWWAIKLSTILFIPYVVLIVLTTYYLSLVFDVIPLLPKKSLLVQESKWYSYFVEYVLVPLQNEFLVRVLLQSTLKSLNLCSSGMRIILSGALLGLLSLRNIQDKGELLSKATIIGKMFTISCCFGPILAYVYESTSGDLISTVVYTLVTNAWSFIGLLILNFWF